MSDLQTTAQHRLEELVSFFGINAQVESETTDEGILLEIAASPETPRLIGYHGDTLRSIEFLINQMMKRTNDDAPRVSVDVAGYKRSRKESLEAMAREIAQRVVATATEEALAPMNPAERRIVHMALRELPGIVTESRGEGRGRYIVVLPAAE